MRLFLNPDRRAYLRELAVELGVSPSQAKNELKHLSDSGLLVSAREGNRIQFAANSTHPLFPELQSMVRKTLGMDRIVDSVISRLGRVDLALLVGDYAQGRDTGIIDLVLVGDIDPLNLADLTAKAQRHLDRRIRTQLVTTDELPSLLPELQRQGLLLLWHEGQGVNDRKNGTSA